MKDNIKKHYADYDLNEALIFLVIMCLFPIVPIFILKLAGGLFVVFYLFFSDLTRISWLVSVFYRFWIVVVSFFYTSIYFCKKLIVDHLDEIIFFSYLFFGVVYILLWFFVLRKRVNNSDV